MIESATLEPTVAPRKSVGRNVVGSVGPLLIAGGFMAAHAVRLSWPRWPVTDASDRICYWIAVAALLGVVTEVSCSKNRRWLMPVISFLAAVACLAPNLWAKHVMRRNGWSTGEFALYLGLLSLGVAALATLTQRLAARDASRPLVPLVLTGMTAAAGGLLMSTGSVRLGEMTFCLAAAVGAYALLSLIVPAIARSAGAIVVVLSALATNLASGYLWSETPIWATSAIAVAPLIAWLVVAPPLRGRSRWVAVPIALILAAIPAGVVVGGFAQKAYTETAEDVGGYDESSLYK